MTVVSLPEAEKIENRKLKKPGPQKKSIIYLKAKDILSRPRLFSEGIPKRAGEAALGKN